MKLIKETLKVPSISSTIVSALLTLSQEAVKKKKYFSKNNNLDIDIIFSVCVRFETRFDTTALQNCWDCFIIVLF